MAKVIYQGQTIAGLTTYEGLPDKPVINGHELQNIDNRSTDLQIVWYGTQAEYDSLTERNNDCIYVIQQVKQTPIVIDTVDHGPKITYGVNDPTGGEDGDIYFKYEP